MAKHAVRRPVSFDPTSRGITGGQSTTNPAQYIRLDTLLTIVPISASTVWRRVKTGAMPAPFKIGPRITCWSRADIERWLAEREAQ